MCHCSHFSNQIIAFFPSLCKGCASLAGLGIAYPWSKGMKRNSKGRPAGGGCVSKARQARNNQKGLDAETARMTKNDVNAFLPAQQASSTPKGLAFGPSPRQQAAEKVQAKQEEEPIGKQDSTTDTQAPANTQSKGSYKDVLTSSTNKAPCEKGASTTSQCKARNLRRQAWQ